MLDNFRFEIEEEYFLVDAKTKRVARRMPEKFLMAANKATDGLVTGEFLQSQVEVATSPHFSFANARSQLRGLRQIVASIAAEHGLAILAAGTHPTALWGDAVQTLELRAPDCCTLIDDAIAIAALYRTLVRHLYNSPWRNHGMTAVSRALVVENKWRAQRYGVHGTFVTEEGAVTIGEMLERVLEETAPDAQALDCAEEIAHCRKIVGGGTSADAQLAVFEEQRERTSRKEALQA